jgi:hypothetical protein
MFEKIQKELDTCKPLRFAKNYKPKNVEDVVIRACSGFPTYYVESGKTQCDSDRLRGIADIYRIAKYYFKDATLKEIRDIIKDTSNINELYCTTTNQTVHHINHHYVHKYKHTYIRLKNWRKNVRIES